MHLMLSHMLKCICNLHSAAFMLTHFQKSLVSGCCSGYAHLQEAKGLYGTSSLEAKLIL